jgi:hypothetical protein
VLSGYPSVSIYIQIPPHASRFQLTQLIPCVHSKAQQEFRRVLILRALLMPCALPTAFIKQAAKSRAKFGWILSFFQSAFIFSLDIIRGF